MPEEVLLFDFDKTLYSRDSLLRFHFFMLKRNPLLLLWGPLQIGAGILFSVSLIRTQQFKNAYLLYLAFHSEDLIRRLAARFWEKEFPAQFNKELLELLLQQGKERIVITASPELYIQPLLPSLGNATLIGTRLKRTAGFYLIDGKNCKGNEKVKRLRQAKGQDVKVLAAYSDHEADAPIFALATKAYLVIGHTIREVK